MVLCSVSTLFWQRSSVRLLMFTLMESMHTLSEETKRHINLTLSSLSFFSSLTYIMSLIKHDHRLLGELFGHQVSYLGVEQVVVAVHHDVGVQDLRGTAVTIIVNS